MDIYLGLDGGHGGWDPGAIGPTGLLEKHVVLDIAKRVASKMKNQGIKYFLNRVEDKAITPMQDEEQELFSRVSAFNNLKVSEVISIHMNSNPDPKHNYGAVYVIKKGAQAEKLALCIVKRLKEATGLNVGGEPSGVREANFYMLRETRMPAVLVEWGFISNPEWEAKLKIESFRELLAEAIFEGYCDHKNIDIKTKPTSPTTTNPKTSEDRERGLDQRWKYEAITIAKSIGLLKQDHDPLELADKGFVTQLAVNTYEKLTQSVVSSDSI